MSELGQRCAEGNPLLETDEAAEDLIASLSGGLAPTDRDEFRRVAESALATSPQCWGPGSIDRTPVPIWRKYFHPPAADYATTWSQERRHSGNKVTDAPPIAGRDPRRSLRSREVKHGRVRRLPVASPYREMSLIAAVWPVRPSVDAQRSRKPRLLLPPQPRVA
jgi:hypothetical protein